MALTEYEQAVAAISEHPHLRDFVGPRPEHLVEAAERMLGLRFPPTYRRFLLEYGAGSFGSAEIYGVIDANFEHSSVPNGIWYTLSERKESSLPTEMVVIYNDGMGDLFCLDCHLKNGQDEASVVTFQPGFPAHDQHSERIADDFGSFLLELVAREIAAS